MYTNSTQPQPMIAGLRGYMNAVYRHMFFGLIMSSLIAFLCTNGGYLHNVFFHTVAGHRGVSMTGLGLVAMLSPLGMLIIAMFTGIERWSVQTTAIFYYVLTGLMGVSLYAMLTPYAPGVIVSALLATAGAFAFLSGFGYLSSRDLSGVGSFCIMGLWGLIIYPLIAMIFHLPSANVVTGIVGVLVFGGLTAYDTQKIKQEYISGNGSQQFAIWGALSLYLDFINLLQSLLQLTRGDND